MSAGEASKPYIDATERSIELNFRSLEYQNDRLNKVSQLTHTPDHVASSPVANRPSRWCVVMFFHCRGWVSGFVAQ